MIWDILFLTLLRENSVSSLMLPEFLFSTGVCAFTDFSFWSLLSDKEGLNGAELFFPTAPMLSN